MGEDMKAAEVCLLHKSQPTTLSLLECFAATVDCILTERPHNATDIIENIWSRSTGMKETVVREKKTTMESQAQFAATQLRLFEKRDEIEAANVESFEIYDLPIPNLTNLSHCFEQSGIGLGREELYRTFLSLKKLASQNNFLMVRFWGKLFGIKRNYIIAEVEFKIGFGDEIEELNDSNKAEETSQTSADESGTKESDDPPMLMWKEEPEIPMEAHHSGANKTVYFVCNEAGEPWTRLPHVKFAEIVASRKISKFLTGCLDENITSYPPFPGKENRYLRALIARISASTHISPTGYYILNDDNEDEEEEMNDVYKINTEFDGLSLQELSDKGMRNWAHHKKCIQDVTPETGDSLLSSAANDKHRHAKAWSVNLSSKFMAKYSVVVAKSNIWPGAYAFARGKIFENIYIGWGKKYLATCFNPAYPPESFEEYKHGPEVEEMDDPDVEVENEHVDYEVDRWGRRLIVS